MIKEELLEKAITLWSKYGQAINDSFGFNGFYIEGEPLKKIIASNSEDKIQSFINYISKRIDELEQTTTDDK